MAFFVSPDFQLPHIRAVASICEVAQLERGRIAQQGDVVGSIINEVQIGHVTYPLRGAHQTLYIPGRGEFLVEGFSPWFVGSGRTQQAARKDWCETVHFAFQTLVNKRGFEMSADERRQWSALSDHIDATVYRNNTPLSVVQFGHISKSRPYPQQIMWENGSKENISLEKVDTPDFVTYKVGQPIEALVARDPLTFELLRVLHVERRTRPSRLNPQAEAALLSEIGSSRRLSETDWE